MTDSPKSSLPAVSRAALGRIGEWTGRFQERLCRAVLMSSLADDGSAVISPANVDLAVIEVCREFLNADGRPASQACQEPAGKKAA